MIKMRMAISDSGLLFDGLGWRPSILAGVQGIVVDREGFAMCHGYRRYEVVVVGSCVGVVGEGNDHVVRVFSDSQGQLPYSGKPMMALCNSSLSLHPDW